MMEFDMVKIDSAHGRLCGFKRRHVFEKHPAGWNVQTPNPQRAIDSSVYRYIFASNNLFQTTNSNPVNQI